MSTDPSFARPNTLRQIASPLAWSAFVAVPAAGWGWLDGVPIGPLEAAAIALIWWTWAAGRHLPGLRILVVLAVAKVALGGLFVDEGIAARYYANDTWTPPIERSIEFRRETFTRLDERLAFGNGNPDLPLHFFNNLKFNFYLPTEPSRQRLAYSAEWHGFLHHEGDPSPVTFYVAPGEGVSGELEIDNQQVIAPEITTEDAGDRARTGSIALEPGWHAIRVRAASPDGAEQSFQAGEIVGGSARAFDGDRILPNPAGSIRLSFDAVLTWATRLVDAMVLSWLGLLLLTRARDAWRQVGIGRLLWLGAIIEALWFASPFMERLTRLGGGDDHLTYEHLSRVIAFGDWMMAEPRLGAGQGGAFLAQPLYAYFLALAHLGFGDSLFGAVLVQRLLLFATIAWVAAMTRRLFGTRAGWIALVGGGLFLIEKQGRWTPVLLTEVLFTPLFVAWTSMLVRIATEGASRLRVVATGVIGGLATLTRSTLLLGWPFTLFWVWLSLRVRRTRVVAGLLVVMVAVVGMATLRNWSVSHTFVPVASSLGITLFIGNQPPRVLAPPTTERALLYERFGLDAYVITVVEYAVQAPSDFLHNLGLKAAYAVGFFGWSGLPGLSGTAWLYVAVWVLALAGIFRFLRRRTRDASPAVWLPVTGALFHYIPVVAVVPWVYGDPKILPLYPLLIPYAAFALEPVVGWAQPHALPLATSVLSPINSSLKRLFSAIVFVMGRSAAWVRRRPRTWLYLGFSAALLHRWTWPPEGFESTHAAYGLLLPLIALTIGSLTRRDIVHRVVGTALFAAALIHVGMAGSLSADALRDPLFWALIALIAAGVSAVTSRRPIAAAAAATVAGVCATMGILLPFIPNFDSTFPDIGFTAVQSSLAALTQYAGVFGAVCLLGLWIQAAAVRTAAGPGGPVLAGVRGALLGGLLLCFAGASPTDGGTLYTSVVMLAVLLGLSEAKAR